MTHGTRRANPARTKKAAPKLSQRGPTASASQEKAAAKKMQRSPLFQGGALSKPPAKSDRALRPLTKVAAAPRLLCVGGLESAPPWKELPPCNASTGSCLAAPFAGNQAEATTDPTPMIQASAKLNGR